MLRLLLGIFVITSCSMGTIRSGGDKSYVYDFRSNYSQEDLKVLSPKVITTLKRDPAVGKLDELFKPENGAIKRIGILIFESIIQPTRSGLAGYDKVYVSDSGKQILTENLLSVWDESLPILGSELDYVSTSKLQKTQNFRAYGFDVPDYIQQSRGQITSKDIAYQDYGTNTSSLALLNPENMRDASFMMVPAYDLMGGPKWSEHNKHFINDVVKELKLDAVIIIMNEINWTAAHTDKISNESFPESLSVSISASTLLPLHLYNERLEKLGRKDKADVTLCYRAYETNLLIPIKISVPETDQNFKTIENEILKPALQTYKDLSQMTMMRIVEDIKRTW